MGKISKMTQAKRSREQALKRKRQEKGARRAQRKAEKTYHPLPTDGENSDPENQSGEPAPLF